MYPPEVNGTIKSLNSNLPINIGITNNELQSVNEEQRREIFGIVNSMISKYDERADNFANAYGSKKEVLKATAVFLKMAKSLKQDMKRLAEITGHSYEQTANWKV